MTSSLRTVLRLRLRGEILRGALRGTSVFDGRLHVASGRTSSTVCRCDKLQQNLFRVPPATTAVQKRWLFKILNEISNKPDFDRIKEAGAQRACAEWLVRCGAHVRWEDSDQWEREFNTLPPDVDDNFAKLKIAEVNAENASVMYNGFLYFEGIDTLRKIRFHQCEYFDDDAATGLYRLRECLEELEISGCHRLTEKGLKDLERLTALKTLTLRHLDGVKNKRRSLESLREALPGCDVTFLGVEKGTQKG